jgi:hypothetical protein
MMSPFSNRLIVPDDVANPLVASGEDVPALRLADFLKITCLAVWRQSV